MDCIFHTGKEAAGTCARCGNPYCRACLIETPAGPNYCRSCAYSSAIEVKPGPSGIAITSMVLSIISLFVCILTAVPGMVMGFVELAKIKKGESPESGRGFALAGAIIGSVMTGLMVLGIAVIIIALVIGAATA